MIYYYKCCNLLYVCMKYDICYNIYKIRLEKLILKINNFIQSENQS